MLTRRKSQTPKAFIAAFVVHAIIAAGFTAIIVDEYIEEKSATDDVTLNMEMPEKRDPLVRPNRMQPELPTKLAVRDVNVPTRDWNAPNTAVPTDIQISSDTPGLAAQSAPLADIGPNIDLPRNRTFGPDIKTPTIESGRPIESAPPRAEIDAPGGLPTILSGDLPDTTEEPEMDETYYKEIRKRILRKHTYPAFARAANMEGETEIRFVLKRDGTLVSSEVSQKSGYKALDSEALRSVRSAAPFPAFPVAQKGETYSFRITLVFELQ